MARQTGLMKVKGTLDNVTFYKTKDGHLAKMKSGVDAERIAKDPAFIRTRENGEEFGQSAKSGKLLRMTVRNFIAGSSDNRLVSRMTQVMSKIKNMDLTSVRGKRNVGVGMVEPDAVALLKGFNFNVRSLMGSILFKSYDLDINTGAITFTGMVPMNDIFWPKDATHASLSCGAVSIDFASSGTTKFAYSNKQNVGKSVLPVDFVLTPVPYVIGAGTQLFLLKIEFFQMVNGVQYPLINGAYNAVQIVGVI